MSDHWGVRALVLGMLVICGGVLALLIWQTEKRTEELDGWDTVAVGARCADHGAEERTFDKTPVYCAAFPSEGMLLWSESRRDIPAVPEWWLKEALTVPPEKRSQVRVCMWITENSDRACQAAIEWSEEEYPVAPTT